MENFLPIMKPGDLATAALTTDEKRWFMIVVKVLQDRGLTQADAYKLVGKAFYVGDHDRQSSLREIVNTLHERSRAAGHAFWKDARVVRRMGTAVAHGLSPDESLTWAIREGTQGQAASQYSGPEEAELEALRDRIHQIRSRNASGHVVQEEKSASGDPVEMALRLRVSLYKKEGLPVEVAWAQYVEGQGYKGREYNMSPNVQLVFRRLYAEAASQ